MTSTDRLPVLDGLRAISILLVLAVQMLPLGPKVLQINAAAGGMGMSLFFALSGFLITSTLMRNSNILEFLAKSRLRDDLRHGSSFDLLLGAAVDSSGKDLGPATKNAPVAIRSVG